MGVSLEKNGKATTKAMAAARFLSPSSFGVSSYQCWVGSPILHPSITVVGSGLEAAACIGVEEGTMTPHRRTTITPNQKHPLGGPGQQDRKVGDPASGPGFWAAPLPGIWPGIGRRTSRPETQGPLIINNVTIVVG